MTHNRPTLLGCPPTDDERWDYRPDEGTDALPEPEPDESAWPIYAICGECDGSGYADNGKDCPLCGGMGLVEEGKEP